MNKQLCEKVTEKNKSGDVYKKMSKSFLAIQLNPTGRNGRNMALP